MKILNLGCGDEEYGDVRVDIFPTKTTTHVMDIEKGLPKSWKNKFDIVYSKNLLEHLRNPGFVLEEMKRVCKSGGKIIIITDNAGFWEFHVLGTHVTPKIMLRRLSFYKGRNELDAHFCLFTKEHLINHFRRIGLKIESIEYLKFSQKKSVSKIRLLLNLVSKILASSRIFENFAYPRIKIIGVKE